jgi:hypothetical protein
MLRPPIFLLSFRCHIEAPFPRSFIFEITMINNYLNVNGVFMPKVPKCESTLSSESGWILHILDQ